MNLDPSLDAALRQREYQAVHDALLGALARTMLAPEPDRRALALMAMSQAASTANMPDEITSLIARAVVAAEAERARHLLGGLVAGQREHGDDIDGNVLSAARGMRGIAELLLLTNPPNVPDQPASPPLA